jgi:hypothetical protein
MEVGPRYCRIRKAPAIWQGVVLHVWRTYSLFKLRAGTKTYKATITNEKQT